MPDLERQLEALRRKLARIGAKYADGPPRPPRRGLSGGREVETGRGKHWETGRCWPPHHHHGRADTGALSELPDGLLAVLEPDARVYAPPGRWVFVDTETTGLAGGSGTLAFLIGAGAITERGFELTQYFMRDHSEEASALEALNAQLERYDVVVTYNGKAFDVPLLETRYVLSRMKSPFSRMAHVDLLAGARRLWRLALERCRLQDLESRILGVERTGDIGGGFIPELYFQWLRTGNAQPLQPVFSHNATDILSLACLTAVVATAMRDPSRLKSGAEMVGVARWLRNEDRSEEALALMREALRRNLDEDLLYETLWQVGLIERKLGRHEAAVAAWSELAAVRNPWQARALERLAMHYEHTLKNLDLALEATGAALALGGSPELSRRHARLAGKIAARGARLP
jgi:uncharacterized protein YprB with RNaseH-like and TPR domain